MTVTFKLNRGVFRLERSSVVLGTSKTTGISCFGMIVFLDGIAQCPACPYDVVSFRHGRSGPSTTKTDLRGPVKYNEVRVVLCGQRRAVDTACDQCVDVIVTPDCLL